MRVSSLRISSQIILLSVAFGIALLLAAIVATGWLVQSIDGSYLERERTLVQTGLTEQVARQMVDQGSIAIWDDAVIAIRNGDGLWLADNLVEWQSAYYGYDRVYLLSPSGEPIRAAQDGQQIVAPAFWSESPGVMASITVARQSLRNRSTLIEGEKLGSADLVQSNDDGLAILTVWPIVPSSPDITQAREAENYLVAIRAVDAELSAEIGAHFLIDDLVYSRQEDLSAGRANLPLADRGGRVLGYLSWQPRRPISDALLEVGPLIAVALLVGGGIIAELLRRLKRASVALEQSEAQASHLAYHDHLSSLENRASFNIKLKNSIADLRETNEPFALFYIDLDRFKQINDALGHAAGDDVIRETGVRLTQILRGADVAARLGGDEFAVIARGVTNSAQAEALGARIVRTLERPFHLSNREITVGASVGGFVVSDHGCDADMALISADDALYQAKSSGRGRFQLSGNGLGQPA